MPMLTTGPDVPACPRCAGPRIDSFCGNCNYQSLTTVQRDPAPNALPAVWDLVVADMRARDTIGQRNYGTRLQPHNGRDALRDAYEEALDLAAYLRQAMYERDGK